MSELNRYDHNFLALGKPAKAGSDLIYTCPVCLTAIGLPINHWIHENCLIGAQAYLTLQGQTRYIIDKQVWDKLHQQLFQP